MLAILFFKIQKILKTEKILVLIGIKRLDKNFAVSDRDKKTGNDRFDSLDCNRRDAEFFFVFALLIKFCRAF